MTPTPETIFQEASARFFKAIHLTELAPLEEAIEYLENRERDINELRDQQKAKRKGFPVPGDPHYPTDKIGVAINEMTQLLKGLFNEILRHDPERPSP